jgi:hypothetical protein
MKGPSRYDGAHNDFRMDALIEKAEAVGITLEEKCELSAILDIEKIRRDSRAHPSPRQRAESRMESLLIKAETLGLTYDEKAELSALLKMKRGYRHA